jgi:hypothetical protein
LRNVFLEINKKFFFHLSLLCHPRTYTIEIQELVKQGKFQVGVVPDDRRYCLLLKHIFVGIMEGGSLAMSAGANHTIFGPI